MALAEIQIIKHNVYVQRKERKLAEVLAETTVQLLERCVRRAIELWSDDNPSCLRLALVRMK